MPKYINNIIIFVVFSTFYHLIKKNRTHRILLKFVFPNNLTFYC